MVLLPAFLGSPVQVQTSTPQSSIPQRDLFSPQLVHGSFGSPSTPTATNYATSSLSSYLITPTSLQTVPIPVTPRKSSNQQFRDPENVDPCTPTKSPIKKRRRRSPSQKLDDILHTIKTAHWTLGQFLWFLFHVRGENNEKICHFKGHVRAVSYFLSGRDKNGYTPTLIIHDWFRSADGCVAPDSEESGLMYSTTMPYTQIKGVRTGLSSFAAQIVQRKLVREAENAVNPNNGLHSSRSSPNCRKKLQWTDIGAATLPHIEKIIREHQPLTVSLLLAVADRSHMRESLVKRVQTYRPPNMVITHAISFFDYCRTNRANLLPMTRGLLYFALSAPIDLFHYNSRVVTMPSYNTTYKTLEDMARYEAELVCAHGRDPNTAGSICADNVQNYLLQRDARIGRENTINIGIAATYIEAVEMDMKAFSLEEKRRCIAQNLRKDVSVEALRDLIDRRHWENIGLLHWLRVLTHYVPEASIHKEHVSLLFRTRCKKQTVPVQASKIHPLATSGKNETIITELKDALVDLLAQIGQQRDDHLLDRILLLAGDGLTFEKILLLKQLLQFHDNDFDTLSFIQAVLAMWHTGWTDLNRLIESHWGKLSSHDPSTLAHNAARIKRPTPSNLKKVDYNSGIDLVYLILDARMLDCWRLYFGQQDIFEYFKKLSNEKKVPAFEDLEVAARKLHRAYSSVRGVEYATASVEGTQGHQAAWHRTVPLGSPWTPPTAFDKSTCSNSDNTQQRTRSNSLQPRPLKRRRTEDEETETDDSPFTGDRCLMQSIVFMRDALVSREFTYALAEGDVGRVYEALKIMLFTFAGSSHSKYTTYLLEFIIDLEYESTPELRAAVLNSLVVNLSGKGGHFCAADWLQERNNRIIQMIAE
ncbi:unnamed protein product [Somion occarium]|uniref:DUF6589 domain-containing protein n=1 Tax=Somion occarium TaxID=3059160 RepID=A0ABP1DIJ0_9APHY